MREEVVRLDIMLVVEFAILVERSQICVFELSVYATIPNLATHRNSSIIVRRCQSSRILHLIPAGWLQGFVVHKILIILRDHLVHR